MKRRRLWNDVAAIAVVAGAIALALVVGSVSDEVGANGSVRSAQPEGRRGLLLVLRELGFAPEPWAELPGRLPAGGAVLWLAEAPSDLLERRAQGGEGASPEAAAAAQGRLDLHDVGHYRRFVEEGGTLVVPAEPYVLTFLREDLGLTQVEPFVEGDASEARLEQAWRERTVERGLDPDEVEEEDVRLPTVVPLRGPRLAQRAVRAAVPGGEVLELDWPTDATLPEPDPGGPARALVRTEDGAVLVASVPVGRGALVLLGSDEALDNARLGETDHALLAVRLVEEHQHGGRLYFDEYALGGWQPDDLVGVALSPRLWPLTLHLALLAALVAWRHAWVREFPRDPEALARFSPLSRARAEARLLERARRVDLLDQRLRRGVLAHLEPRRAAAPPSPSSGAAWEERVQHTLLRAASQRGARGDVDAWVGAFTAPLARDARELARRAAELETIEAALAAGEGRGRAAQRGRA